MNNLIILNHLRELKFRLLYVLISFILTLIILYIFSFEIIYISVKPLLGILDISREGNTLIYTDITEVFFSFFKMTFIISFLISLPFLIYQIYFFILPGIYEYERNYTFTSLILYIIVFIINLYLIYFYLIPTVWSFFLSCEETIRSDLVDISFHGKLNEYIQLLVQTVFAFTICFQIPIILMMALIFGIANEKTFLNNRRSNVILCFILGALFSPPDIISQVMIAIPLCIFYELIILLSLFLSNKSLLLRNNSYILSK